jgi:hypothetical protein
MRLCWLVVRQNDNGVLFHSSILDNSFVVRTKRRMSRIESNISFRLQPSDSIYLLYISVRQHLKRRERKDFGVAWRKGKPPMKAMPLWRSKRPQLSFYHSVSTWGFDKADSLTRLILNETSNFREEALSTFFITRINH